MTYKEAQQQYKELLKPRLVHASRVGIATYTCNLGIKEFKRNFKEHYLRKAFKQNAWSSK